MAGVTDVVVVSISANTSTASRVGFGVPLFVSHFPTSIFSETYREYTEAVDMQEDGFSTVHPAYRMVSAAFQQDPRPEKVILGRHATAPSLTRTITVTTATEGAVISFYVVSPDGTATKVSRTVPAASSTTAEATAIELLVEACQGVASSSALEVITATPAASGDYFYLHTPKNCTIKDTTADANYDDTLGALAVELGLDSFYFVATDCNSEANVDLVAAWCETNKKVYGFQTSNTEEANGTGTMLAGSGSLSDLGYDYALPFFAQNESEYVQCAAIGFAAPRDPGSYTLSSKKVTGVSACVLTSTQETNLQAANCNYVTTIKKVKMIRGTNGGGVMCSGEYLDIIHGTDWLIDDMQTRVVTALSNVDKLGYEDSDVDVLVGLMEASGEQATTQRLFAKGTFKAWAGKAEDQSTEDRGTRYFPALYFTARYSGAIHKVRIRGSITV